MYQLTDHGVIDTKTGAAIPNSEGNRHWREFAKWLARDESIISFSNRHNPNLPLRMAHEFLQERE